MAARELVELVVRSIVSEPDAVEVEEFEEEGETVFEVSVADDDIGRVIGKGGRVVQAIRVLARAAGAESDQRIAVEILD